MRRPAALALLVVAALAFGAAAAAQPIPQAPPDPGSEGHGWVAVGLGAGSPHGTAGAASINIGRERFVQVGYEGTARLSVLNIFGLGPHASALHVGVGTSHVSPRERTAVSIGPAVAWGVRDNDGAAGSTYVTAGLVVNGQLLVAVSPEIGFGAVGFVNMNPVEIVAGVALSLAIGSFR